MDKLDLVATYAKGLERDAIASRYPGERPDRVWIPSQEFSAETAEEAMGKAERCLKIAQEFFDWWFAKPEAD